MVGCGWLLVSGYLLGLVVWLVVWLLVDVGSGPVGSGGWLWLAAGFLLQLLVFFLHLVLLVGLLSVGW